MEGFPIAAGSVTSGSSILNVPVFCLVMSLELEIASGDVPAETTVSWDSLRSSFNFKFSSLEVVWETVDDGFSG